MCGWARGWARGWPVGWSGAPNFSKQRRRGHPVRGAKAARSARTAAAQSPSGLTEPLEINYHDATACLCACVLAVLACLPVCLLACLRAGFAHLIDCLLACLLPCLPACLPTYPPTFCFEGGRDPLAFALLRQHAFSFSQPALSARALRIQFSSRIVCKRAAFILITRSLSVSAS